MSQPANRIVLLSRGRYEEYTADADVFPGYLLQKQSDGGVIAHATAGGNPGPLKIAIEDALQGGTVLTKIPSGSICPTKEAAKGDVFMMLLAANQSVVPGGKLMSNGDGTLASFIGSQLYRIAAASSVITNTTAETAFSNGSFVVPANTYKVGDVIRLRGRITCVSQNSTNTHNFIFYIGGALAGGLSMSTGAIAVHNGDIVDFDLYFTIRTITSSGTVIGSGLIIYQLTGTNTPLAVSLASTTLDTTVAQTIQITSTASAASTSNQVRLDDFMISLSRAGDMVSLFESKDTLVTTSSAAFLRAEVI